MTRNALIANAHTTPPGARPAIDIVNDLPMKRGYSVNSWFAIGHFEADGHVLNYLAHVIVMSVKGIPVALNSSFSVTDQTTGWYGSEDKLYAPWKGTFAADRFVVRAPNCSLEGDLETMRVRAEMKGASIDLTLHGTGHPLYNKGTGRFELLGLDVRQYSLPTMETSGQITIEGRTHDVAGTSWFDRQWQNQNILKLNGRWTWMDLNLSNGLRLSLWEAVDTEGRTDSWVTCIDEHGTHRVAALTPLTEGASDYWLPASGNRYPTRWHLTAPELGLDLVVTPSPREQELQGFLPHYEAASDVAGTIDGEQVTGYCYVEMVGDWKASH